MLAPNLRAPAAVTNASNRAPASMANPTSPTSTLNKRFRRHRLTAPWSQLRRSPLRVHGSHPAAINTNNRENS